VSLYLRNSLFLPAGGREEGNPLPSKKERRVGAIFPFQKKKREKRGESTGSYILTGGKKEGLLKKREELAARCSMAREKEKKKEKEERTDANLVVKERERRESQPIKKKKE